MSAWFLHRFEHADGRWCDLATNQFGAEPDRLCPPPAAGFALTALTQLVSVEALDVSVGDAELHCLVHRDDLTVNEVLTTIRAAINAATGGQA